MPGWLKFGRQAEVPDSRFPKDASLHDVRYAVVDTELTSLDTRSNRLIFIGAITMDGTKIRFGKQF
jgi:DNA polymerase III epsilon subunit-like protein